jgi:flagellar protein FlaG
MELTPLPGGVDPAAAQARAERMRTRAPEGAAFASHVENELPADYPPASVWAEVDKASQVVQQLQNRGRELHFEHDKKSGSLVIEVRDLEGKVLRRIPPSEALAIAAGAFT